jgi:riboflavin kinase/FMN adenylyltransferase
VKIFHGFDQVGEIRNAVVTTGSFDGVHVGHKAILERLNTLAAEIGGETVLITFHPHPRKVLYPDTIGKELQLINSLRERIDLLRNAGMDNLIIVNFTLAFSRITSFEFVRDILLKKLHARKIVIGSNHHFGHNRQGDYESLRILGKQFGFDVEEIPEQDIHNETVSSAKIRLALQEGNIPKANAYLDYPYMISGPIRSGENVISQAGFSSFKTFMEEDSKLIPPNGIYATTIKTASQSSRAMTFIKKNKENLLESLIITHPFERLSISGNHTSTLCFHKRMRDEMSFETHDEFKKQLQLDKILIQELIF